MTCCNNFNETRVCHVHKFRKQKSQNGEIQTKFNPKFHRDKGSFIYYLITIHTLNLQNSKFGPTNSFVPCRRGLTRFTVKRNIWQYI